MTISIIPPPIPNSGDASAPTSATATTTSSVLLAANTSRKWAILTNEGVKDVFLAAGQDAEVDKGFLLSGGGSSLVIGGEFFTTESINGITKASSSAILILEAT